MIDFKTSEWHGFKRLDFEFKGTLVYYKINLNHYDAAETLDTLDFDYL